MLGLREELSSLVGNTVMVEQMKDVLDYRTMDYYQRRYRRKEGVAKKSSVKQYKK